MTARKIFGTDGIRGTANQGNVTPEMAMRLGMAAATYFRRSDPRRHLVVIGKDTRLSGYMLEPALTAGFTAWAWMSACSVRCRRPASPC